MNTYIPADKLIAEIEELKSVYSSKKRVIYGIADGFRQDGMAVMCDIILTKITSLQKEQPEQPRTCKTCSLFENDCPFVRGKFIPYPSKGCKDYTEKEVEL